MVVRPFDEIFRDFVTDGVPSSGPHHPYKPDIRDSLNAIVRGAFPDNRVIKLNNANEGTANEIVVSASVDIPTAVYQVLYVLNVTQENTGPVTVSGAINRKLVTNTSEPIPAGYLKPGMAVLCIDTGSELRMLSYGDVESSVEDLVRQAEAALADAEQARDQAQNAASDAVSQGNVPIYSTLESIASLEIPAGINAIRVNGRNTVGDGQGGLYVSSDNGSTDTGISGDGRTWWRVKDVGGKRLSEKIVNTIQTPETSNRYRKKIIYEIPSASANYAAMVAYNNDIYLVPQAFAIDWQTNQIFIVYCGTTAGVVWIEVWNLSDNSHVGSYRAPLLNVTWTEGIVIKWEGNSRFLYLQSDDLKLSKYDITSLPPSMTGLVPTVTFNVNLFSTFSYKEGTWLIQSKTPPVGLNMRRYGYLLYDDSLSNVSGFTIFDINDVGSWGGDYKSSVPKVQTMGFMNGGFVSSNGGLYLAKDEKSEPYSYCGVKLYNTYGSPISDSFLYPEKFRDYLRNVGYFVERIEYEGAVETPSGRIWALCNTIAPGISSDHPSKNSGILIIEEYSPDIDAVDLTSCASRAYAVSTNKTGVWPRVSGNNLLNPLTGERLGSLPEICDFMSEFDVPHISFYSLATSVAGIGGFTIPQSARVDIVNNNNGAFELIVRGYRFSRFLRIFGSKGDWNVAVSSVPQQSIFNLSQAQILSGYVYNISNGSHVLMGTTMTADGEITLSANDCVSGDTVTIKRYGGAFNLVIKNGVNGSIIATMTEGQTMDFIYSGSNWMRWR